MTYEVLPLTPEQIEEKKDKAAKWIISIVKSCNDPFQLDCCKKLLETFKLNFADHRDKYADQILTEIIIKSDFISVDA